MAELQTLSAFTTVVRDQDIVSSDMDGQVVMMSIAQGKYYGLTGIGSFLWEQLAEPISFEALCQGVLARYQIDAATCEADVREFLEHLLQQGTVRIVDAN